MEKILSLFGNVKGGLISTLIGVIFLVNGFVFVYKDYKANELDYDSISLLLVVCGVYFLLKSDEWIQKTFKK